MEIIDRLQRAVKAFNHKPVDMKAVEKQIDNMISTGELPTIEKERSSKLDIRKTNTDYASYISSYNFIRSWVKRYDGKFPDKISRDVAVDEILYDFWQQEPILAGAVYSMTAKMESLKWNITGKREPAIRAARLLARAAHMGGYDWGSFIAATCQDFYTTNRGVFWETAKEGDPLISNMIDIGHIDALCCTLTGNSESPVVYASEETGQIIRFKPGEFIHFASMASPRERDLGAGYCAIARAYKAAKLLMGLHDYDAEKLSNLPPEGIAAVSGLTLEEFNDAIKLWLSQRSRDNSLTFPQVLWLIGSQPNATVSVDIKSFSQIPESFDRKSVVEQYINTLALDFGVDAREFWSINAGNLGSGAESEIQHLKAKGKGPGEFITITERSINGELPESCDFMYDTQDIEEDANSAAIAKAWIDAYFPLYNLPEKSESGSAEQKENNRPNHPDGSPTLPTSNIPKVNTGGTMGINEGGQSTQASQVIDKKQFMRLLADKGVIPDWLVNDKRVAISDTSVHNYAYKSEGHPDDVTTICWDKGVLKEIRPAPIVINSNDFQFYDAELLEAKGLEILRQKENQIYADVRNIRGEPIPESESTRGGITINTLKAEMERWRNHPILKNYAIPLEEEQRWINALRNQQ